MEHTCNLWGFNKRKTRPERTIAAMIQSRLERDQVKEWRRFG